MAYPELSYLIVFLPLVLIAYQLIPAKWRWAVLLLSGYAFCFSFGIVTVLYLAGTTLFTFCMGAWLRYMREHAGQEELSAGNLKGKKAEKAILVFGIAVLLSGLGYLKYYNFFVENWNQTFAANDIFPYLETKKLLVPLGISFYTLEAIGCLVDIYWGKTQACRHPGKLALFLGFFPKLMEGPLSSYSQTAEELWAGEPIRFSNLSEGFLRILWGLFKKLIIADRLNVLVGEIFGQYWKYHGAMIAVAAIAYTLQLYTEFSGVIDIVIGSARMFGVHLPENFRQPFFAEDAADFWRRWHISLGSWFRTYVFFPVSVSGPVKRFSRFARKRFGKEPARIGTLALTLFPVWLCNGLWHGANWSFLFYGMYYFVVLLLTEVFHPVREKVLKKLRIRKEALWYRGIRIVKTWVIIFVGELFFRAENLQIGIRMFGSMFKNFSLRELTPEALLGLGLDEGDFLVIAAALFVVLIVGIIRERQQKGVGILTRMAIPLRWSLYYVLFLSVVIFGAYGVGYQPVDLIYAGF